MLYAFKNNGDGTGTRLESTADMPSSRWPLFVANVAANAGVPMEEILLWSGLGMDGAVIASIVDGQVVGVTVDPDYTPPEPAPDPVQARLEALESAVAANLLVSPHDRRWLAQKERAKLFGIPWLREHPEAEQQDLEMAVLADLAEAFPAQPLVVSGGVIMSYAAEAASRGYIPDASFASLKSLILASSEQQLQAMLAAL